MFENFRGDFDELAATMEASWSENVSAPFLYTPEFLADCFRYPGASFSLAPTLYREAGLSAFVAGFPRRINLHGEDRNVLIVALLTVEADKKSSGYGILVWSELVKRARAAGYDGVVNYCVEGEAMNRMIEGTCARLGLPVSRVASLSYLSKVMWHRRSDGAPSPRREVDAERFLAGARKLSATSELSRVWTLAEAEWQLTRSGAVCAVGGDAVDPAVLTGYVMPVADRRRTPCLVIEDVVWNELTGRDRTVLVDELIGRATEAGARLAILPMRGYADTQPFRDAGFRPSQKQIHAYLTLWSGEMPAEPVSSYYLDVF